MLSETTYSGILGQLQRFLVSMAARIGGVLHLEPSLTQQLQAALVDGQRPATLPRKGLQQHHGLRSERPTELGSSRPAAASPRARRLRPRPRRGRI